MKSNALLFFFLMGFFLMAQHTLQQKVEILNPEGFSGFVLIDSQNDSVLFSYHADKNFIPASNVKTLTLWESRNLPENLPYFDIHETQDTLYLKPNGNPAFCKPNCKDDPALAYLKKKSKTILIDSTQHIPFYAPGWSWEDYEYEYQPEKSMANIYGNLIEVNSAHPAFQKGLFTLKDTIFNGRTLHRNVFYRKERSSSVKNIPFITSYKTFATLLEYELNTPVLVGKMPHTETVHNFNHPTVSRDSLLIEMMFESDNFIAEQLGVMLENPNEKKGSTYFNSSELKLVDYSGLSRYNMISPNLMVKVLQQIQEHFPNYKDFFPSNGKGTLKSLLPDDKAFIYAKSGSMGGVYNLSGYLTTQSGKTLIFCSMNNNFTHKASEMKKKVSQLLLWIHQNY